MMKNEGSFKARERKLRAKYQKRIRNAVIFSLIIGLAAGFAAGHYFGRGVDVQTMSPANTAPLPNATEPVLNLSPSDSAQPGATAIVTPTPTPVATVAPTPEPTEVIVPSGESYTFDAQVYADGTKRINADAEPFETLNFTLSVKRYLDSAYYVQNYADKYRNVETKSSIEFELLLNDHLTSSKVFPQTAFEMYLENERGEADEGFNLLDAEIDGQSNVELQTNVPKLLYKRFTYSEEVGAMKYLCVKAYVDGAEQTIKFELEAPKPEATATPAPTSSQTYATLQLGDDNESVAKLQAKLIELGYLSGDADGKFGAMTETAIKAAQNALGLAQTGIADNAFQQKLFASERTF